MAKNIHRLTDVEVKNRAIHGNLSDGGGLYLKTRNNGNAKSWLFRWSACGKRNELTIGSALGANRLSLAQARKEAALIRDQIGAGLDPREERKREAPKTFLEMAEAYMKELEPTWKHPKTSLAWKRSLLTECKPLHNRAIDTITDSDCRSVVMPVYKRTPDTATRLRKRLETILGYAEAHGMRSGINPARWEGHFKPLMVGSTRQKRSHYPSMPNNEVPAFIDDLKSIGTVASYALEFLILTCVRSNNVLKAEWSEIDFENALWSIPADKMKNGYAHEVPLTERALEILNIMHETRVSEYVFPSTRGGKNMSDMALTMLMRRRGFGDYVPHGFRSSFRTWCGNETQTPREVAEAVLAHRVGSAVELAYSRGDALEKRRRLMPLWSDHCAGKQAGDVVRLNAKRG